ncbi:MAG: FKBP-type peptidyl-prolyl cis-trans isomerase [Woeseiaceae bacterium]|nr:FKBP-type peptidyl-prolyl cis-trans isomerase [Woeseiaceae bacterium]
MTGKITRSGYGRAAVAGDYADVHTTLWLYDENTPGGRGTEIWTSGGTRPFQFMLDSGQVIRGWDLGVACMLVGETRELTIPPELGYGARGKPPVPPNATLLFEIELVKLTSSAAPES